MVIIANAIKCNIVYDRIDFRDLMTFINTRIIYNVIT